MPALLKGVAVVAPNSSLEADAQRALAGWIFRRSRAAQLIAVM